MGIPSLWDNGGFDKKVAGVGHYSHMHLRHPRRAVFLFHFSNA